MEIVFSSDAKEDLAFWTKTGNKQILKKIIELIRSIKESPFQGLGKPEGLKHNYAGLWSRRIDREHRLVYEIRNERIIIFSLRGHYMS